MVGKVNKSDYFNTTYVPVKEYAVQLNEDNTTFDVINTMQIGAVVYRAHTESEAWQEAERLNNAHCAGMNLEDFALGRMCSQDWRDGRHYYKREDPNFNFVWARQMGWSAQELNNLK